MGGRDATPQAACTRTSSERMEVDGACATWCWHLVEGATPWAKPGLWAHRRGSPGPSCSRGSEPDPAPSSEGSAVPFLGWDFQCNPAPALEGAGSLARPLQLRGHPARRASMRESVGPASCLLGTQPGRPAQGRSQLSAPSKDQAGSWPHSASGEQFKNCWKASLKKKKKVSVKTCLAKRASLAQGLGWAAPLSAVVLTPRQAGRHRKGTEQSWQQAEQWDQCSRL